VRIFFNPFDPKTRSPDQRLSAGNKKAAPNGGVPRSCGGFAYVLYPSGMARATRITSSCPAALFDRTSLPVKWKLTWFLDARKHFFAVQQF
jgi:hypothetical protein